MVNFKMKVMFIWLVFVLVGPLLALSNTCPMDRLLRKNLSSKKIPMRVYVLAFLVLGTVFAGLVYAFFTTSLYFYAKQALDRRHGITVFVPEKSFGGYTAFLDSTNTLVFMNPNGSVARSVRIPVSVNSTFGTFYYSQEDCSVIFSTSDEFFGELDPYSRIRWSVPLRTHHAFDAHDGLVYALAYAPMHVQLSNRSIPVVSDDIVVIARNGTILKRVSLLSVLMKTMSIEQLIITAETSYPINPRASNPDVRGKLDITHSNKIEVLRTDLSSALRKGYVLFSARNIHLIGIINLDTEELVWSYTLLEGQHSPTVTDRGTVLVFDNGPFRGYSQILEIDPQTNNVTWTYTSFPKKLFFSHIMGSVQQLPNHNLLITESTSNQLFEITPSGEKVWEFKMPAVETMRGIFQAKRFGPGALNACPPGDNSSRSSFPS